MSIKYDLVEPGMTLYQKKRQRMGHTTMSCDAVFTVRIVSKDDRGCMASWNTNAPRWMSKRDIEKLYRNRPKVKPDPFTAARIARKPEAGR